MNAFSLDISIARQRLDVVARDGRIVGSYGVSTSRFGSGSEPGSYRTPVGRFQIREKIGAGAELGMIFKSRQPLGRIGRADEPDDFVQTRILWLSGLEAQNANTYERFIYVHGTNQEPLLGWPASHGCVRMGNADIAELFERISVNSEVKIG